MTNPYSNQAVNPVYIVNPEDITIETGDLSVDLTATNSKIDDVISDTNDLVNLIADGALKVSLPAATVETLTPSNVTNYAVESGGNLDDILAALATTGGGATDVITKLIAIAGCIDTSKLQVDIKTITAGETHIGQVGCDTSKIDVSFKTSGGTVAIPSTPTAYTAGYVVGTNFEIANVGRKNGGSGILYNFSLREIFGTNAYNGQAVTCDNSTDKITLNSHTLVDGNKIKFGGTAVPTGLTAGTTYYVVNSATNDFKVAATYGGTAINFTTDGTSVTITEVPLQAPMLLLLSNTALESVSNNTLYDPSGSVMETLKYPVNFSSYTLVGRHAISDGDMQRGFKCAVDSSSMYGVLLYNSSSTGILSKNAYLLLTIIPLRD